MDLPEKHSGPVNELSGNRKLAPIISPLQTHRWAELLCTHPVSLLQITF